MCFPCLCPLSASASIYPPMPTFGRFLLEIFLAIQMGFHVLLLFTIISAGADYNSTTRVLTFNGSRSRIGVLVSIILDEFTELNEQFRANLSLVDDSGINVSVSPDQSIVEIINDDSKCETEKKRKR